MTTQDKIKYIESFTSLISRATTYRDALSHAMFVRGMLAAYHADNTISIDEFKRLSFDVETIMEIKRKLPVKGDVV